MTYLRYFIFATFGLTFARRDHMHGHTAACTKANSHLTHYCLKVTMSMDECQNILFPLQIMPLKIIAIADFYFLHLWHKWVKITSELKSQIKANIINVEKIRHAKKRPNLLYANFAREGMTPPRNRDQKGEKNEPNQPNGSEPIPPKKSPVYVSTCATMCEAYIGWLCEYLVN